MHCDVDLRSRRMWAASYRLTRLVMCESSELLESFCTGHARVRAERVQQSPNEEALVAADLQKLSDDGGKDGAKRLAKMASRVATFSQSHPGSAA